MTTKRVPVHELHNYIGKYVTFTWSDGWDDYDAKGYFQGITSIKDDYSGQPKNYVHLSEKTKLDKGYSPSSLGGFNLDMNEMVTVHL